MQLKHKGKVVTVTLTQTEQRLLGKAVDLLSMVALVPCGQQVRSSDAAAALAEIAGELTKPVPESKENEQPGLPFEDIRPPVKTNDIPKTKRGK